MSVTEARSELTSLTMSPDGSVAMSIGGAWCAASDGAARELIDPGTGEPIGRVAEGTRDDARRAIAAARAAFDHGPWRTTTAHDRAKVLFAIADAIEANAAELVRMETLNAGKPLRETEYDVADAANCFRYYAGIATKAHGQSYDVPGPSQSFTVREPIGVCGMIVPWNYPLLMATWKLAPALAAGNTCVLKPSELTPLTALRLVGLMEAAGLPAGVVNVVTGAGPIVGAELAASHDVDKIAFTGGTSTGRAIMSAAVGNLKNISLELGGKSPNIVFADADFETAVDYALFAIYAGCGQVCSAGSRLILDAAIHDRFVARLVERARTIVVGNGFDSATEMGPLISAEHLAKVEGYIATGIAEGAHLACGGARPDGMSRGNFLLPTIFTGTTPQMRIVREEIFGPVLVVQRFSDEAEAIALANDTVYGLAGGVFTSDAARALRVVRALRAGITWVNTYHPTYNEAPWGGYKQSGIGRELGTYGYDEYTEVKQINVNLAVEPTGWFGGV